MKITVIGTGYVGLVQGVILSEFGHKVICLDIDEKKINNLNNGILPIYEPGLKDILDRNVLEGRLKFTTDKEYALQNSEVIFIAVGTPPAEDGSADLTYVLQCAKDIGKNIKNYAVVVNKSTVPVGTGDFVEKAIKEELKDRGVEIEFDVVSNPEFLREGKAVNDCLRPDRVVIGTESKKALEVMKKIYDVLYINKTPFVFTNRRTSEMIKYASNAFLAVKISFINEMALLAEKVGANTQEIAQAMGMDGRISPKFLHCGPGYGGSCFPKDTKAIVEIGKEYEEEMSVVASAISANEKQKKKMIEKIIEKMDGVENKTICILGLSFKPDTDDVRDAPSLDIIKGLIEKGAFIKAYCPKGIEETKWRLENYKDHIMYCKDEEEASTDSDAVVLVTEWNQFRGINLEELKERMKGDFYFDLRNVHAKHCKVRSLFKYFPVGQN
ncbi:UDP-glucose/GDP-mannose dehydrogenase family protein [Cetobacterium somerae]|uniref:UDP-glucose dehydrogenase family protein n=1 Tax=Cetobacterium sp. NK01 TaxID=2993530 RepID=UPI002116EF06|nr:UDP-glucose/GDP-mannose dehydrogenase family protein [Cetobacterium sp. NK01]MCQ8212979.1 UDP-glucose/GDP-mannose dehydrogenase family protein [Cetobacterium sp. NK01]